MYYKTLKKAILRVQLTHNNLQNIYRRKGNFEGLRDPQNKCSNLILKVKRPLNNLLPRFKRFIFTTLDKEYYLSGLLALKIRFYFIYKKNKNHNQAQNIYIYTHKNSQLLRWYAMILIYNKSSILLQLHFLWFLNSNLQINKLGAAYKLPICQLLFKRKDINNHILYKDQICPRDKKFWYIFFFIIISKVRSYQLVQLNISAIMGALKFLKKREWYQKFVNFRANISTHLSIISNSRYPQFQKEQKMHNRVHISK